MGMMDREQNKPMAIDAIFRLYSMSKPITSVALMQLHERGLFQLTDPVSRFIPQWRDLPVLDGGDYPQLHHQAARSPDDDARPALTSVRPDLRVHGRSRSRPAISSARSTAPARCGDVTFSR